MIRKLAMAMVVSGALGSSYANALGLGEIKLNSALNQPLDAEVKLLNVGDLSKNEILPNLASHNDFSRAGVERVFFLTGIKFDVELDGKGGAVLHLTTDRIVREPFLNFLIELHWPSGRLLREYTALLDPPLFSEAAQASIQQAATSAPTTTTVNIEPAQPKSYNPPSSSAQSAQAPVSNDKKDGTVRVKKNDTLWGIAKENRPDRSVTVRQTMVAIQQHNPQAFINNNINLLKSGQVLRIPETEEIRRISSGDAYAETVRQTREWEGKKTIDATQTYGAAPAASDAGSDEGGLLKLVATDSDSDADSSAESASGGFAAEGGMSTDVAGDSEASGSGSSTVEDVDALQKQLDDLQRLMTLKQEQLALLQAAQVEQEAESQVEAELASAAEEPVVDDSGEPEAVDADGMAMVEDESTTIGALESQEAVDAAAAVDVVEESAADDEGAPAPVDVAAQQPRPQEGIMDILLNNPLYIGVLLVVILGGLILLGAISRRRKEEKEDYPQDLQEAIDTSDSDVTISDDLGDDLADVEADSNSNSNSVGDLANAEPLLDESAPEKSTDETRKLLDESDIFIAYGRYERAIEILQPAVNNAPENTALRLKLAETYLLNNDEARFSQQEADLQAIGDAEALASLDDLKSRYAQPQQESAPEETVFDVEENAELISEESAAQEDEVISFDVEESSFDSAPEVEDEAVSKQAATEEFGDLEFELPEELDVASDDADVVVEETHENLVDFEASTEEDFLDFDTEEESGVRASESVSADDMDFLVDTDESATKLELAKAYIDMADADAAQEILNEVVSEGSEAQQQEARKLLENLE